MYVVLNSSNSTNIFLFTWHLISKKSREYAISSTRFRKRLTSCSRYTQEKEATETKNPTYSVNHEWREKWMQRILDDYAGLDPAIYASLTRARQEFPTNGSNETWEEWRQGAQVREEATLYTAKKAAIMKDLTALKESVRQLLDANETRPEIERLLVPAFDVDRVGRDQRLKAAKDTREDVRMELEHVEASTDRVANWIKKSFWDPQVVPGRSLFSFRGDTEVTNYPLLAEEPFFKEHLQWAQFSRESMRNIVDGDTFQPWRVYTDDQLQAELSKPMRVRREDEEYKMDVFFEDEKRKIDDVELTEQPVFDGGTL